jgi:hypothetical protein
MVFPNAKEVEDISLTNQTCKRSFDVEFYFCFCDFLKDFIEILSMRFFGMAAIRPESNIPAL